VDVVAGGGSGEEIRDPVPLGGDSDGARGNAAVVARDSAPDCGSVSSLGDGSTRGSTSSHSVQDLSALLRNMPVDDLARVLSQFGYQSNAVEVPAHAPRASRKSRQKATSSVVPDSRRAGATDPRRAEAEDSSVELASKPPRGKSSVSLSAFEAKIDGILAEHGVQITAKARSALLELHGLGIDASPLLDPVPSVPANSKPVDKFSEHDQAKVTLWNEGLSGAFVADLGRAVTSHRGASQLPYTVTVVVDREVSRRSGLFIPNTGALAKLSATGVYNAYGLRSDVTHDFAPPSAIAGLICLEERKDQLDVASMPLGCARVPPLSTTVWTLYSEISKQATSALFANRALIPYVYVLAMALYTGIQKFLYMVVGKILELGGRHQCLWVQRYLPRFQDLALTKNANHGQYIPDVLTLLQKRSGSGQSIAQGSDAYLMLEFAAILPHELSTIRHGFDQYKYQLTVGAVDNLIALVRSANEYNRVLFSASLSADSVPPITNANVIQCFIALLVALYLGDSDYGLDSQCVRLHLRGKADSFRDIPQLLQVLVGVESEFRLLAVEKIVPAGVYSASRSPSQSSGAGNARFGAGTPSVRSSAADDSRKVGSAQGGGARGSRGVSFANGSGSTSSPASGSLSSDQVFDGSGGGGSISSLSTVSTAPGVRVHNYRSAIGVAVGLIRSSAGTEYQKSHDLLFTQSLARVKLPAIDDSIGPDITVYRLQKKGSLDWLLQLPLNDVQRLNLPLALAILAGALDPSSALYDRVLANAPYADAAPSSKPRVQSQPKVVLSV